MKVKILADFQICISVPLNHPLFCWSSKSPLKVPWKSWTLGPLGDLQETSLGRCVPDEVYLLKYKFHFNKNCIFVTIYGIQKLKAKTCFFQTLKVKTCFQAKNCN